MARSFSVKKVRKQMYPATFNFMDEADGTSGTDIDFVDVATIGANTTLKIKAVQNSHRKVIEMYDNDGAARVDFSHEFTAQTYGTIEFWLSSSDVSKIAQCRLRTGAGTTVVYVFRFSGSNLQYYAGGGAGWTTHAVAVNDQWYHIKIDFECTAGSYKSLAQYEYHVTIDGTKYSDFDFANDEANIDEFFYFMDVASSGYYNYIDAWGESWDANYKIGDNVHWRHYKESTDVFESDDVGTQGTSIIWVDGVDTATSTELIQEFNEYKKILRQTFGADTDYSYHTFATQSKTGWISFWYKVSDVTTRHLISIREGANSIIQFQITGSKFQVYDGALPAYRDVTGAPTPVNDTWYLIYLQWYDAANDTFDLWIDNIQYESGVQTVANQTFGITRMYVYEYTAAKYGYIDAPISSLDSDERGDNRTFDYNDKYTREDITTLVKNVIYKNEIYKWRKASLKSETSYENTEVFFQIYDINSKLAMEADIKNRAQISKEYLYSLRDKNQDDLENRSSNTFTTSKIHDPTDSTSMLKIILPNVSEANGDLILVDADTKTDTYSPVTKNYPDYLMLRDIADLADSVVIIQADGKVYLDDNKASGTTLNFDTEADKDKMTASPLVTDILETINYFEIFGAINPDTGTRFYKIIDNVGSDKKKSWRYTNNEFRNQTDVDNYATALKNRTAAIKNVKFTAQSLGVHNMGETLNYKYVDALYNIPQANYYIIFESIDFDLNENTIILSEGMIESSKYAAVYELPENYNDSYASEIYETDINTVSLAIFPDGGATAVGHTVQMNAANELGKIGFYTSDKIDPDRSITIYFVIYITALAGDGKIDMTFSAVRTPCDCSSGGNFIAIGTGHLDCESAGKVTSITHTIAASNVFNDNDYTISAKLNDGPPADIFLRTVTIKYHIKRSV